MPDLLYDRDGDIVSPTILTQGPWTPDAQHGGAPAALMGGEIERILDLQDMAPIRLSFDFLRPVPIEPLVLNTVVVRSGKRVQMVDATLEHDGTLVARASGVGVRRADHDYPFGLPEELVPVSPIEASPVNLFDKPGAFAARAFEIRMVEGDFNQSGPGAGWFRLRVPVTDAGPPTALETACAAADFGNGVSNWDPEFTWLFINPELTIHFARPPVGEWVYLNSTTRAHKTGTGLASTELSDLSGRFGQSAQPLLIEPFGGR